MADEYELADWDDQVRFADKKIEVITKSRRSGKETKGTKGEKGAAAAKMVVSDYEKLAYLVKLDFNSLKTYYQESLQAFPTVARDYPVYLRGQELTPTGTNSINILVDLITNAGLLDDAYRYVGRPRVPASRLRTAGAADRALKRQQDRHVQVDQAKSYRSAPMEFPRNGHIVRVNEQDPTMDRVVVELPGGSRADLCSRPTYDWINNNQGDSTTEHGREMFGTLIRNMCSPRKHKKQR
eukprot:GILJ01011139.1.p1 GENE.GILJ01011139.1~~GILJ01011139.1.p1  ORF type:complete len:239 (+),score=30.55 GILJ01011139.1:1042-1758(+)